ncbi:MAG: hypothetical protein ABL958_09715, partial [Bdellovibrionia bacterium]
AAVLVLAAVLDGRGPSEIALLSREMLFAFGLLAVIAGAGFHRLFGRRSSNLAASAVCGIAVALLSVHPSADVQARRIVRALGTSMEYCPDLDDRNFKTGKQVVPPGCELIARAFDLGLIKNLGSCEASGLKEKAALCHKRLSDEPWLHYFSRSFRNYREQTALEWEGGKGLKKDSEVLRTKLSKIIPLTAKTARIIEGAPRASHHIFTNLLQPKERAVAGSKDFFAPQECHSRYRKLADPSLIGSAETTFDDVYGLLLFSQKYPDVGGFCTEYEVHWNSSPDTCEKLAADPEGFLRSHGLQTGIRAMFSRLSHEAELRALNVDLKKILTGEGPPLPPAPWKIDYDLSRKVRAAPLPQTVVSFQCLMTDPAATPARVTRYSFELFGKKFESATVTFAQPGDTIRKGVRLKLNLAQALHPDFEYKHAGRSLPVLSKFGDEETPPEFYLTRLERLKQSDLFVDDGWVDARPDLIEIYPYYFHLGQFVRSFRVDYRTKRTRM